MLFILNVSHSYLPAFSRTHTPPWPVMITWQLLLSRSAWPSCCYTQWSLLSPHRTPSLSSCDPCPGFPGHHTLHVLFLSLPPVHSVSCAGSGLPSFLKMLQCPGAPFPATCFLLALILQRILSTIQPGSWLQTQFIHTMATPQFTLAT